MRSATPLSRWAGLRLFLGDGRVEIDSNIVECAIRPLALNRINRSSLARTAAASIGR
ncbi:IS66 family transposase [Methylobacterium sp. C25]|uniref:IS66 family transposase n=1 Tax=Methylobacterium sp. C25 TaxID=2721622 RepID=UPI003FA37362